MDYWLQFSGHAEKLEGAILDRRQCWIEHEGGVEALRHRHGVAGERGEVGEQRAKAMDGQAFVGALACGLAIGGVGMVACGMISDRLFSEFGRRAMLAALYCLGCAILVASALSLGPGTGQLVLLGAAMFLAGSTAGPAGAMVANLTPAALHGTAFAVLTLANNAFGLAPGPIVTGWLADRIGLLGAMQWLPLASLCAAVVFLAASRRTEAEVATATAV